MEKPAVVDYPVHALIERRWSPRAFADQAVEPRVLRSLLEAARWTASCFNEQPWRFLVARRQDAQELQRMVDCLTPNNQRWAKDAAVLMITLAIPTFAKTGKPNRHAWYDVGQAAAQMTVQATALGLFVHQMAGLSPDKVRETYGVPDEIEPVSAIAIGYPGDPAVLPDDLHQKELAPRTRRPQSEIVFCGAWGRALPEP